MSQRLISRSPDLQRLQDEGFDLEVRGALLLVKSVPYVNKDRQIQRGVLIAALDLANDVTRRPDSHVVQWVGEYPCTKDGARLVSIENQSGEMRLDEGLVAQHCFSNKPSDGYPDYYAKMVRYVDIISHNAMALDPNVTARTHPLISNSEEDENVFQYVDTATGRAGIGVLTRKLRGQRIAIIGIGGTGAYVLDLVAKTPVAEIHLYDGDTFKQHNAFRTPGATPGALFESAPNKAEYFGGLYSKLHKRVFAHDVFVREDNIEELRGMDFVFICVDNGEARRLIATMLDEFGVSFVDVGMGVVATESGLSGLVRTTASTPGMREPLHAGNRIPFSVDDDNNEYNRNIQIADLNALNATLAVIKWKKFSGFYADMEHEHHSIYSLTGNHLFNEDRQ